MQIAVCDDNQLFLDEIGTQLRMLPIVDSVDLFPRLDAFFQIIEKKRRHYHAVLLDMDWGEQETGLEIAQQLYHQCPETKIIYVTGYNDRFSQHILLHRANLSGYLTKPVDLDLLQLNLRKVQDDLPLQDEPALVLQSRGKPVAIPIREIFYIESRGHTLLLHTGTECITVYGKLSAVLRSLPEGFFQCHKSFAVNLRKVQRFRCDGVLLKNGFPVPVSRTRYAGTKAAYFQFMGGTF